MSLIKVVPYVLGMTPGVPGAPEPRIYPCSGYFLVAYKMSPIKKNYYIFKNYIFTRIALQLA